MTVVEFKRELESFLTALDEHRQLWRQSINNIQPSLPTRNTAALREQALRLSRQLGRLRPYIERFMPAQKWVMHVPLTGSRWNALDMAVSANALAQIKGASIQTVTEQLHQLLGRLDGMSPTQDLNQASIAKPQSLETPASGAPPRSAPPGSTRPASSASPAPPTSAASPPESSPPVPVAALNAVTLEQVSLRDLASALGRLSLGAWVTILSIVAGIIGATITVTRSTDQGVVTTIRDSVRKQQRSLDSLRARGDSLAAVPAPARRK